MHINKYPHKICLYMHRIFWKDSRQLLKVVASRERSLLTGGKENIEARLLLSSFYIM